LSLPLKKLKACPKPEQGLLGWLAEFEQPRKSAPVAKARFPCADSPAASIRSC